MAIDEDASDLPGVGFDPDQTRQVGNEHYVDVVEGVGTLKLTVVVRTGESELPASGTVTYIGNQAAQEGSVYEATTKKWTLAAGDTSVSFPVKILDDEDDPVPVGRTFRVLITPVSGARPGNILSVAVNVLDDDPTPVTLAPGSDVSLGEGDDENAGTATLTLARYLAGGEVFGEVVEVPLVLTTSTGAELPGSGTPDFTLSLTGGSAASGDVVLSGGNTATPKVKFTGNSVRVVQTVGLAFAATARDDGDFSDETFKVALGDFSDEKLATTAHGGAVASEADNIATFTIVDDDEEPAGFVLSVDADTVAEDVSKAPTITVTAAPIGGTAFIEEHDIAVTVGASGDTGGRARRLRGGVRFHHHRAGERDERQRQLRSHAGRRRPRRGRRGLDRHRRLRRSRRAPGDHHADRRRRPADGVGGRRGCGGRGRRPCRHRGHDLRGGALGGKRQDGDGALLALRQRDRGRRLRRARPSVAGNRRGRDEREHRRAHQG